MARAPATAAPTEASLHEAAVAHLARYATTQAGLVRVLDRRIERWARASAADGDAVQAAKRAARVVAARLVASGVVDDAAFAASRASRLVRTGHSRRAVAAHLAARGIAGETVQQAAAGSDESEFGAAVVLAHRRRIGPFRRIPADADSARRELGMLARAGFSHEVATRALAMDADAAEELVNRLRQS
jgi:regulatory protein